MASVLIIHSHLHLSEDAEFCAVGVFRKASVTQNGGFCRADSPVGDLERGSPCLRLQPLSTAWLQPQELPCCACPDLWPSGEMVFATCWVLGWSAHSNRQYQLPIPLRHYIMVYCALLLMKCNKGQYRTIKIFLAVLGSKLRPNNASYFQPPAQNF